METKILLPEDKEKLLSILKIRFEQNTKRHHNITWDEVKPRLRIRQSITSLNPCEIKHYVEFHSITVLTSTLISRNS